MARTISDMLTNTRTRLGDPRAQAPGDSQLLQQVTSHIRTLLRAKMNVSNPWNFAETFVEITPGEDTYLITNPDFGTPLVVTTVPENPNQVVRIIPFYCPQNLDYSWGYPQNAGAWGLQTYLDGSNCNALRCAIFWQGQNAYIRFNPIPQLTPASYKIQYLQNANAVGIASLNSMPLVDQDVDLVEIRAAKSLLGLTEWSSPDTKEGRDINSEKRRDMALTLTNDEALAYQQFQISNRITVGPRISNRWSSVEV